MSDSRLLDPAGRSAAQFRSVAESIPASGLRKVSAADYAVGDSDATVLCSTMQGPVTITLPRAAASAGRQVMVRKADSGQQPVKIQSVNGEPVAGQAWVTLVAQNEFATFISDGTTWQVGVHF